MENMQSITSSGGCGGRGGCGCGGGAAWFSVMEKMLFNTSTTTTTTTTTNGGDRHHFIHGGEASVGHELGVNPLMLDNVN